MAVNHSNLFDMVGEILQRINEYEVLYASLDTDLGEIETDMDSTGNTRLYQGWYPKYQGFKNNVLSWISNLSGEITSILLDKELVVEELNAGQSPTIQTILIELYKDMITGGEYFTGNTMTIGSPSYDTENASTGTLLTSSKMGGYNSPLGSGGIVNPEYMDGTSQLGVTSEDMSLTCISDSEGGGGTEGYESWNWASNITKKTPYHYDNEGSGGGPNVQSTDSLNLLTNGNLVNFTSDAPNNWTVNTGTAGIDFGENTTATTIFKDSQESSLKFISGTGVNTDIEQTIILDRSRAYAFGVQAICNNATISDINLDLSVTIGSTGNTSTISFTDATSEWEGSFGLLSGIYVTDKEIDGDVTLKIVSTAASGHDIYINDVFVVPLTYHGGVGVAVVPGADKFLMEDRLTFTIANNDTGVFQTFFRKAYGFQMPSSGSIIIADSKAT